MKYTLTELSTAELRRHKKSRVNGFNFSTKSFVYEGLKEQNGLLADGNYYVTGRVKL